MTLKAEVENGLARVSIDGAMTIYHANEHKSALLDTLRSCAEMEISLTEVGEMDTAGLQILLLAKREADRTGKLLRLVEHSPATLSVLALYNLGKHLGSQAMPDHSITPSASE